MIVVNWSSVTWYVFIMSLLRSRMPSFLNRRLYYQCLKRWDAFCVWSRKALYFEADEQLVTECSISTNTMKIMTDIGVFMSFVTISFMNINFIHNKLVFLLAVYPSLITLLLFLSNFIRSFSFFVYVISIIYERWFFLCPLLDSGTLLLFLVLLFTIFSTFSLLRGNLF